VAAAIGAIVGDNIAYVLGRRFGYTLLPRYGHLARIDAGRIKLGQYVFARHGAKVVFIGRFVAVLRALAALLAASTAWAGGGSFSIAEYAIELWGDLPYSAVQETVGLPT
jgi:membrane protein DedA with SNARE-associated domain